ncbi:MAG: hypothetical protein H6508_00825 [Calditrichaeota bacterium]|nr:hypothetical protein [Calditrichota bacterium]MCB9365718.1 hypothetical protein [Calditrichota bacterium]
MKQLLQFFEHRRALQVVALGAIALRLAFIFVAQPPLDAVSDAPGYDRLAHNLIEQGDFIYQQRPSAERTPVYPVFVAGVYSLGGDFRTVSYVQAVLDGGSLLLLGPIGASLGLASSTIVAAATLAAVFPPLVQQPAYVMTESLYQILLLAAIALTLRLRGAGIAALCGLLWGLVVLTRPTFSYFVAILAVWIAIHKSGEWRRPLILFAVFLLALTPWLVRNQRTLGSPVLSTFGFQNIYAFNSRLGENDWNTTPNFLPAIRSLCASKGWGENAPLERSDVQIDSLCKSEAMKIIKAHTGRFAALSMLRVARLWGNVGYGRRASSASRAVAAFMGALLLLFFTAFLKFRGWKSWPLLTLVLLFFYQTAIHAISVAYFRFNQPLLPIFFLLAAWAAHQLFFSRTSTVSQGASQG